MKQILVILMLMLGLGSGLGLPVQEDTPAEQAANEPSKQLVQNWGQSLWYQMEFTGQLPDGTSGKMIKGIIHFLTQEDNYNNEPVFRFEDTIYMDISLTETPTVRTSKGKITTICRQDTNLSALYIKKEEGDPKYNAEVHIKPRTGPPKDKEVVEKPNSYLSLGSLFRFITLQPFADGTTTAEMLTPGPFARHHIDKVTVEFARQEELAGQAAYKFILRVNPEKRSVDFSVWISPSRQLLKMILMDSKSSGLEVSMISESEAKKHVALFNVQAINKEKEDKQKRMVFLEHEIERFVAEIDAMTSDIELQESLIKKLDEELKTSPSNDEEIKPVRDVQISDLKALRKALAKRKAKKAELEKQLEKLIQEEKDED